jgi:hypothetical protein
MAESITLESSQNKDAVPMRPLAETARSRAPMRATSRFSGTGDYTLKGRAIQDVAPHHESAPNRRFCTTMRRPRLLHGFKEPRPFSLSVKQTPCPNFQALQARARHLEPLAGISSGPGQAANGETRRDGRRCGRQEWIVLPPTHERRPKPSAIRAAGALRQEKWPAAGRHRDLSARLRRQADR